MVNATRIQSLLLSLVLIAQLSLLLQSCNTTKKNQKLRVDATVEQYKSEAEILLQLVSEARRSPSLRSEYIRSIAYESEKLMQMGLSIAEKYIEKNRDCAEYIKAALALPEQIASLSLHEVEVGYLADQRLKALPGSSLPECQRAKNLLVQPAAVLVLSGLESTSTSDFDRMSDEINEVIAHSKSITM